MSLKNKDARNHEFVLLANNGLSYRDIGFAFELSGSRIKDIAKRCNSESLKKSMSHCVRCLSTKSLVIPGAVLNICKPCVREIKAKG